MLGELHAAGLDGGALVDATRRVLVHALHIGIAIAGCAALCAVYLVKRIAHIRFRRAATAPNRQVA